MGFDTIEINDLEFLYPLLTPNCYKVIMSISTQIGLAEVIQGDTFSPLFFFSLMESLARRKQQQGMVTRLGKAMSMSKEMGRNYKTLMSLLTIS